MKTYEIDVEITLRKTVKVIAFSKEDARDEIEADPSICDWDVNDDKTDIQIYSVKEFSV